MLLCGTDSNKGFRNWKVYHHQNCLHGELPIHIHYFCLLENSLAVFCCIYQYAHALLAYTRIFLQTLSMLVQQHYQEKP